MSEWSGVRLGRSLRRDRRDIHEVPGMSMDGIGPSPPLTAGQSYAKRSTPQAFALIARRCTNSVVRKVELCDLKI